MSSDAQKIASEALQLPESDRLGVAQRLWESCDLSADLREQIDNHIALHRAKALDSGDDAGVSARDTIANARAATANA